MPDLAAIHPQVVHVAIALLALGLAGGAKTGGYARSQADRKAGRGAEAACLVNEMDVRLAEDTTVNVPLP